MTRARRKKGRGRRGTGGTTGWRPSEWSGQGLADWDMRWVTNEGPLLLSVHYTRSDPALGFSSGNLASWRSLMLTPCVSGRTHFAFGAVSPDPQCQALTPRAVQPAGSTPRQGQVCLPVPLVSGAPACLSSSPAWVPFPVPGSGAPHLEKG